MDLLQIIVLFGPIEHKPLKRLHRVIELHPCHVQKEYTLFDHWINRTQFGNHLLMLLDYGTLFPFLVELNQRSNLSVKNVIHDGCSELERLQVLLVHVSDSVPDSLDMIKVLLCLYIQIGLEQEGP